MSQTACTAVGFYGGSTARTLVESWNGTKWSLVRSPNPSAIDRLFGVSCVSASNCTAVGTRGVRGSTTGSNTLVESWNGATWSVVPSPSPVRRASALSAVSCVSAGKCTAVGYAGGETLVESWNGATWSVVPSPSPSPYTFNKSNVLLGVSCPSASACTAVGTYLVAGGSALTLVESWNGTAWSVVRSPNPGIEADTLVGVSCSSASACTAVGTYDQGSAVHSIIASWNGATWSVVGGPHLGGWGAIFPGVSCTSASACTIVGYSVRFGHNQVTLIESWNGHVWSLVPSPATGALPELAGVSCVSASACTAVGDTGLGAKTLIESSNGAG